MNQKRFDSCTLLHERTSLVLVDKRGFFRAVADGSRTPTGFGRRQGLGSRQLYIYSRSNLSAMLFMSCRSELSSRDMSSIISRLILGPSLPSSKNSAGVIPKYSHIARSSATEGRLLPEDNKAGIRVAPAHIRDQLNLIGSMLIRVVVRPAGAVAKGFYGTVITPFPAINILPVGFILNSSLSNPKSFSIFN